MITQKTAAALYNCHQQIKNAEKLIIDVKEAMDTQGKNDLRDVFGHAHNSLQLSVPSGRDSRCIFNVDFELAVVIIDAQILKYKSQIKALNELAKSECLSDEVEWKINILDKN